MVVESKNPNFQPSDLVQGLGGWQEYWMDDGWYVGKLKEVVGVFSQGESLEELEDNIRDAYRMLRKMEIPQRHPG